MIKAVINSIQWYTVDKVLCVSDLMRQRSILNGRIPAKKCAVVQNGINPVICPSDVTKLRDELGISDTTFLVITTGSAPPYKRFDFVIECARILLKNSPGLDIKFLLVGNGPAMPDLKLLVEKHQLENHVS